MYSEKQNLLSKSVPHVTLNGVYDPKIEQEMFKDLTAFICINYKGDLHIDACNKY